MGESAAAPSLHNAEFFRDAFNASSIGIAVENLDGQPLFVNPAFCHFLGFTEEELLRKHCVDFSPKEDAEKDWALFQQLRAGTIDHYQLEKRYFRQDGSLVWGHLSISVFKSRPSRLVLAMIEDITEKKRTEESLCESEERLRLAVQAGRMFAYSWDADSDVIDRSGESAEILGVKNDQASTGAAVSAMVHADDRERVNAALSRLTVEEPTLHITYRIMRADGVVKWLERNSRAYFDAQGKLKRVVGMIADVTDRKLIDDIRFRHTAMIESSEDAIIFQDVETRIASWNAGAERMFGYSEAEVLGQPITIIVPPHLHDEENRILERLEAGEGIGHYETKRVTKTGKTVDVSLSISPIKNAMGNVIGFSKIAHEITDRKRAEEALLRLNRSLEAHAAALQSREELLQIFVKNVPAGVAMFDRDMRYLQVSDRWCTLHSIESSQVLGRSLYDVFPDLPDRYKEAHRRAIAGETVHADDDRWDRERGTIRSRWEIHPWRTPDGTVGGILIFVEDISHRKEMEEALSGISRKLIEAQEQERMRVGRELHDDINQKLALLNMELGQLKEGPADVQSRVRELQRHTDEISNDVQALSHELASSKLEYLGAVAGIRSWCKEFTQRSNVEIDFRNDVETVVPFEIGVSLFRVLQEALHNALKHSGVKRLNVQLFEDSGEIHLIVSDLGRGFDVEAALRGQGLGLTSMRERIRSVKGTISIESKPMGGTTIHVRVPLESKKGFEREAL